MDCTVREGRNFSHNMRNASSVSSDLGKVRLHSVEVQKTGLHLPASDRTPQTAAEMTACKASLLHGASLPVQLLQVDGLNIAARMVLYWKCSLWSELSINVT